MKANIKDIVTVVQLDDLNQVIFQAHSIETFIVDPVTHWIIVQDRSDLDIWKEKLQDLYIRHQLKIIPTLLPDSEDNRDDRSRDGYRNQMILKLMAVNLFDSERYIVLDSKNFFIKKQSLNDWPTLDGRPVIERVDHETIFRKHWLDSVTDHLGIKRVKYGYEILTPFVMTSEIAKKCCEYDLILLFNEMIKPHGHQESEFLFYSMIAYNFFEKLSIQEESVVSDYSESDTYYLKTIDIDKTSLEEIYTRPMNRAMGIHRDVVAELTDKNKKILTEWFVGIGLDQTVSKLSLEKYQ